MSDQIPHPHITTREWAERFLREYDALECDCYCTYGHHGCSTYNGGPCLDETLNNFPELA